MNSGLRSLGPIVIVAAMGRNRVIGVDNGLPWRMRSDLRQFRAATMGKPMVMGRKTYEAIGRPLPGRDSVVVTRDASFFAEGVHAMDSLEGAFVLADMLARAKAADEVIVAGGATVYAEAMDFADRLLITEIDLEPEGDAMFPESMERRGGRSRGRPSERRGRRCGVRRRYMGKAGPA